MEYPGIEKYTMVYNLSGQIFGRLTVLRHIGNRDKRKIWLCQCECGKQIELDTKRLTSGNTRSCGCLRKDMLRAKLFRGYEDIAGEYWSGLQLGAKNRNLEFSITLEYVWSLFISQGKKCALSGIELTFAQCYHKDGGKFQTASLDRIDSQRGYVVGNVQWVHKIVNNMKKNIPETDFIEWCRRISECRRN